MRKLAASPGGLKQDSALRGQIEFAGRQPFNSPLEAVEADMEFWP